MDTNEIKSLIDKVIGKEGALRTPAYWMRRVLKIIVGRIDEKAKEVKSEIDIKLKGKIDRAIPLTYKEFRDMCYKKAGINGQYYHISDYKPTLSEQQEEFNIASWYEGKLYVKYNGVIISNRYRDYCDTVFEGYVFTGEKTYEVDYVLHDSRNSNNYKWMMGYFESFDTIVVRYESNEGLNNLTLRNKASIEGKSEWWLFEDALTQEEYEVWNYNFEVGVLSLSLRKVGDSGIYHDVKIVDYTFRTYGSILRMKDCSQNLEVCYDFIGMSWTGGNIRGLVDSKIIGYYFGLLPRVKKEGSYEVNGVEIINSDKITIYGSYQKHSTKLRIVDCYDVYCSACDNVVLDGCENVSISDARDCYFLRCIGIESATQLYSSVFWLVNAKKIEYVYDSYLYSVDTDTITQVVGIGFGDVIGSHVAIKDGQMYRFYKNNSYSGATPVYPKTTTAAVTDESSGKTMDVIIQELQDRITALEGA
jgi:hypothetical protein